MSAEKPRLGKGLGALLGSVANANANAAGAEGLASDAPASDLQRIPLSRIRANPFQPRQEFDPAELAELQASLQASGLLQPITVRRRGDAYELIAGERRFRAATNLGWTEISAIVRDFDDRTMLVLALVENLQRANLNALEEARGYRRLLDEFNLTQQQVADAVGKDRTTVTNLLRVLSLPEQVQQLVEQGKLSTGHARALLALPPSHSAIDVARKAIEAGFSVRELEQFVREISSGSPTNRPTSTTPGTKPANSTPSADPAVRRLEDDLRRYLQTDVKIHLAGEEKGSIELRFYSNEDLERILELVLRERRADF
jgi:ParB family chromosome partitioning protein